MGKVYCQAAFAAFFVGIGLRPSTALGRGAFSAHPFMSSFPGSTKALHVAVKDGEQPVVCAAVFAYSMTGIVDTQC